jgi:UDP-glucose 4-epimerase
VADALAGVTSSARAQTASAFNSGSTSAQSVRQVLDEFGAQLGKAFKVA